MALSARLELRQGQSLVITPQLQQAIKLLQLSSVELEAYVDAEIERNPLLQRDEGEGEGAAEPDEAPPQASLDDGDHEPSDAAKAAEMDAGEGDLYGDSSPGERDAGDAPQAADAGGAIDWSRAKGGAFEGLDEMEGALARAKTLSDHLHDQSALAGFTPAQSAVAAALIDAVDEGGYLRADLGELAERLAYPLERIEAVLHRLQGFEPTGVFARDVRECLMLQLKERDRFDPAMAALLDNLELLAKRDMAALRRACAVDEEDLRDMIAELRALTPPTCSYVRARAACGGWS
jgi:RNA polymerase sigma-54 factor